MQLIVLIILLDILSHIFTFQNLFLLTQLVSKQEGIVVFTMLELKSSGNLPRFMALRLSGSIKGAHV